MKYFTYTLTAGSITISTTDYVQFLSIKTVGTTGSCTVLGNLPFQGITPNAVTLTGGDGLNLSTSLSSAPLDGITITWVAGSVDIVIGT